MSGKIVMIGSMKGGVSKTVTTFNIVQTLEKYKKDNYIPTVSFSGGKDSSVVSINRNSKILGSWELAAFM